MRIHEGDNFCRRCGARVAVAAQAADASPDDAEVVLWRGTFSWKGLLRWWLAAGLITLGLPVLAAVTAEPQLQQLCLPVIGVSWGAALALLVYKKLTVYYVLSNQRLVHEQGFFYRQVDRLEVIDIDDLRYEQSILERLVGTGRILVTSSDRSNPVLELDGIDRASELFELLDRARREERLRHGVHIETI
ncbi:MAG: PH domain-containing protein [Planctomycetota bacterium]